MGDELRYMGTSTVVRDIEEMSRVLEGPEKKINFFGGSYGTILGAYLVNMIPDKIGRVIIDGVASAPDWANQHSTEWLPKWLKYTEETFQWFLRDCVKAGPHSCPLAKKGEKPEDIEKRLEDYLDDLYYHPLAIPDGARPGILTSGGARALLYATTNQPGNWLTSAHIFASALSGNSTRLYNALVPPFDFTSHSRIQTDLSRVAVSCLDGPAYDEDGKDWPTAEYLVEKTLETLNVSRHFGASIGLLEPDGGCQFWKANKKGAPERFTGPWNSTLETPMLIISNTADPITPLSSGRELNALMGNSSRLLIQNSPGHCSLGSVSACTAGYWRRYFLEGKLPEDETVCEVDRGYFPTVGDGLEKEVMLSGEEMELRMASEAVAKEWERWASRF